MYKNYFYLNRLTTELKVLLNGASLISSFSQEKNILVLELENSAGIFYLLINVTQNDAYIQYKKDFHRAKKNVSEIFRGCLPQDVTDVRIAENDRMVKIQLQKQDLIFFVHGKDTNVVLFESPEIFDSFKKIGDELKEKIQQEITRASFISKFYYPDLSTIPLSDQIFSSVKKSFPSLSREILNEIRARMHDENPEQFNSTLKDVLGSIYSSDIAVFNDSNLQRMVFAPDDFRIFSGIDKKIFTSYFDALNYFLVSRYKSERAINYKKIISKHLDQHLSRIATRINELRNKLEKPSREHEYRNIGNLLLANLYSIQKGQKDAELNDFDNRTVIVKLDEKLDAKKNTDAYFEKAKNEKQNRIALTKLFSKLEDEYQSLTEQKKIFETATTNEEYIQIMADLRIKDDQETSSQQDDSSAYRHFLIEKKYHLYVGRDSRNNDQLTTRFAKQNDYWFHARSVSGSHVVLRVDNTKEVVPKSVLKKAASIAAFYSKAKTSKLAPVAYTLKKYVVKRKGMDPGSVNLLKENVILVEPGIPEGCEYLNE